MRGRVEKAKVGRQANGNEAPEAEPAKVRSGVPALHGRDTAEMTAARKAVAAINRAFRELQKRLG